MVACSFDPLDKDLPAILQLSLIGFAMRQLFQESVFKGEIAWDCTAEQHMKPNPKLAEQNHCEIAMSGEISMSNQRNSETTCRAQLRNLTHETMQTNALFQLSKTREVTQTCANDLQEATK